MQRQIDWQKILNECQTNVQNNIKPCAKSIKEPNLGTGAGGDQTKPVDLAAETAIVETFKHHNVSFTLISEESGIKQIGNNPKDFYVTVDPVDGTTNFLHGLPFYASSIAVSRKPELTDVFAGTVIDLFHGNSYTASHGEGAFRNGKRIATSKTKVLSEAVIGLDLNTYKVKEVAPKVTALIAETRNIRHFGANALELCFVAEGLTDAFVDLRGKLRTTDVAAGFLILKEAGGIVATPKNQILNVNLDPKQTVSFIASANKEIHKEILSLVHY